MREIRRRLSRLERLGSRRPNDAELAQAREAFGGEGLNLDDLLDSSGTVVLPDDPDGYIAGLKAMVQLGRQ